MSETRNPVYMQEVTLRFIVILPADPEADDKAGLTWPEVGEIAISAVRDDIKAHGLKNATEVVASRGPGGRGLFTNDQSILELDAAPHVKATISRGGE